MKISIPLICVVSLALAEPPIDEGYPSARSSHDYSHDHDHEHDHNNDFQRSLSQEYGPPSIASARSLQENGLSREYLPPKERSNLKSSLSQTYGPPNARSGTHKGVSNLRPVVASKGLSTKYGVPTTRSGLSQTTPNARSGISQEYGVPSARSSSQYSPSSRSLSTKYGVPDARSGPSQTYGVPAARSGLSQEYGVPSVRSNNARTLSAQYGAPEASSPSEEYGVPSQRSFDGVPSQKYGPPKTRTSQSSGIHSARSGKIQDHTSPRTSAKSFASSNARSSKVSPKFGARSSLTSFGSQATKSSYSQDILPQTHGAPNQHDLSDTIEVPSARSRSQEHGGPINRDAKQMTSTVTLHYSSADRSALSDTYGAPAARDSKPSEQYGVPDQYSNLSNDGYPNARNVVNDALNEEPASYDFSYKVEDYESGSDFGHTETRQDNRAEGAYFVVLPDGTKQVVEYEADERGFKPRISVEPADFARSAGHDDNAHELASSANGPY